MTSKPINLILLILLFVFGLSACTASESDCDQDKDCPTGFYCAQHSGGVIFGGGICVKKSGHSQNNFIDTDTLFDTGSSELDDAAPVSDASNPGLADTQDRTDTRDTPDGEQGLECTRNDDCGQAEESPWTNCDGFADSCAIDGTQTRQILQPTCENGFCSNKTTIKQRDCQRETKGEVCGSISESQWSDCNFDGFKSRELSTPTCGDGTCSPEITTETLPCSCTTDLSCGEVTRGAWGKCIFQNTCSSTGTKEREVRTPTCTDNSCTIVTTTESDACSRDATDGIVCGQATQTDWTNCSNPNTCATSGTRTRQTLTPTCQDDECTISSKTDSQNCALTAPSTCGQISYSDWGTCKFEKPCDTKGIRERTKTTPTCQNQTCNAVKTTESDDCIRTMPTTCGEITYGNWGECTFANPCTDTGTKKRTKFTPTCQNETCNAVKTTESDSCTRTLPTGSCGQPSYSAWSECKYPTTCSEIAQQTRTKTTPTCQNKVCSSIKTTETQDCGLRITAGSSCGPAQTSVWSKCVYEIKCARTAPPQKRTTTTPVCLNGTCSGSTTQIESKACPERDTTGHACDNDHAFGFCDNRGCCDAPCPPDQLCKMCGN